MLTYERTVNVPHSRVKRTPIAHGACESPMNKIFILKNDCEKKIAMRESTVLLFIKIKDSIVTPF